MTIDSREARPGALFVPLPGERTDGHEHVLDAMERGATGYLVAAQRLQSVGAVPGGIAVDDPADALLGLGAWVRDEVDPAVITITGSTGKTTTKDLTAAATGGTRPTVANVGSYNNELGVPLTCCRLDARSEVLVAEVGARGVGHIASLGRILRPNVAVVTSVGSAHLELLGDLDTVARAKSELVAALQTDGIAVLNADDERVAAMAHAAPGRVVTYGLSTGADWTAREVTLDQRARPRFVAVHPEGEMEVALPVAGAHNVGNALAALAAAAAVGVDPAQAAAGLAEAAVSRWRMELLEPAGGPLILNDAYNANPQSMRAALDTLAALPARRRWAALGLMAELGAGERDEHEQIGRRCAEMGLDGLVVVGADAAAIAAGAEAAGFDGPGGITLVAEIDSARAHLRDALGDGDALLVKASRAVGLERLARELAEPADAREGGTA